MRKFKCMPPVARVKELLDYDPETGIFTWRKDVANVAKGSKAGCTDPRGYVLIGIEKRLHCAHRLAWLWFHEEDPVDFEIDHIDGLKSNKAIANLRLALHHQNAHNEKLRSTNTSGVKGVHRCKQTGKWAAKVRCYGKRYELGRFNTKEAAAAAVAAKREEVHGQFARHF